MEFVHPVRLQGLIIGLAVGLLCDPVGFGEGRRDSPLRTSPPGWVPLCGSLLVGGVIAAVSNLVLTVEPVGTPAGSAYALGVELITLVSWTLWACRSAAA